MKTLIAVALLAIPLLSSCTAPHSPATKSAISPSVTVSAEGMRAVTKNPLFVAIEKSDTAAVAELLAQGADVNVRNDGGETPLHRTAMVKKNAATAELLLAQGADVNAQNKYGYTPLHTAALMGRKEEAKKFIEQGLAMPNRDKDDPETKERGRKTLKSLD